MFRNVSTNFGIWWLYQAKVRASLESVSSYCIFKRSWWNYNVFTKVLIFILIEWKYKCCSLVTSCLWLQALPRDNLPFVKQALVFTVPMCWNMLLHKHVFCVLIFIVITSINYALSLCILMTYLNSLYKHNYITKMRDTEWKGKLGEIFSK